MGQFLCGLFGDVPLAQNTQLTLLKQFYNIIYYMMTASFFCNAHFPSSLPCSTADSANSMVCDVSGKEDKEEEEKTDKEEELTSCESVQERRRQENENSALEAIWEKAASY